MLVDEHGVLIAGHSAVAQRSSGDGWTGTITSRAARNEIRASVRTRSTAPTRSSTHFAARQPGFAALNSPAAVWFVTDSALEKSGFELPVPLFERVSGYCQRRCRNDTWAS